MATGRIGVTPVLRTRWSDQPTTGTTVLSGLDDNSVALVYDAGYEAVYRNGVLLSRGNDYTATNGTTITLIDATLAGDIIEVFANDLVPLTDAISKGQYNAKGALLSASAASTPGVLTVGTNGQVLTADSAETTGLKWVTPAAGGGMTLLSTTSMSGSTQINLTSINQTYKDLVVLINQVTYDTSDSEIQILINAGGTGVWQNGAFGTSTLTASNDDPVHLTMAGNTDRTALQTHYCLIKNYASSTAYKPIQFSGTATVSAGGRRASFGAGAVGITTAITSLRIQTAGANNFNAGTILLYGVN
jgi:hypothetical protein